MRILFNAAFIFSALVLIGLASGDARADGITLFSPGGQPLVPSITGLTLQQFSTRDHEFGGVDYIGGRDTIFGDVAGPQRTVAFSELGLVRAGDLRILLNLDELHFTNKLPITLEGFFLSAYDQSGNRIFQVSFVPATPLPLDSLSDYLFGLDSEAAARLQAALATDPALRLGLEASLFHTSGGPERFSYTGVASAVPEPATVVLFGSGLLSLAGAVRRHRQAAAAVKAADTSAEQTES